MNSNELVERLRQHKIVAIFRGTAEDRADRAARALLEGGISLMEVTMNTEGALRIIARWRETLPGQAVIGAGTVLDLKMAREAAAAGARFLVSPNLDEEVVAYGEEQGIGVIPGVMTPTEIVRAWKAGAAAVKVFPMGALGWRYLKEIRAPLNHIPMVATGGIDLTNIADYFRAGAAAVGLGGNLINQALIEQGEYNRLTELARQYMAAANGAGSQ